MCLQTYPIKKSVCKPFMSKRRFDLHWTLVITLLNSFFNMYWSTHLQITIIGKESQSTAQTLSKFSSSNSTTHNQFFNPPCTACSAVPAFWKLKRFFHLYIVILILESKWSRLPSKICLLVLIFSNPTISTIA